MKYFLLVWTVVGFLCAVFFNHIYDSLTNFKNGVYLHQFEDSGQLYPVIMQNSVSFTITLFTVFWFTVFILALISTLKGYVKNEKV